MSSYHDRCDIIRIITCNQQFSLWRVSQAVVPVLSRPEHMDRPYPLWKEVTYPATATSPTLSPTY